jgi:hypothetical protein
MGCPTTRKNAWLHALRTECGLTDEQAEAVVQFAATTHDVAAIFSMNPGERMTSAKFFEELPALSFL